MTVRPGHLGFLLVAAAAVLVAPVVDAEPPTKGECIRANAHGQGLRREGRFAEARQELRLCNQPVCPPIVSEDCTRRLDELEAAQPTIIFDAQDRTGQDLSAVTVTIDGKPFADRLVGIPLEVDAGEHEFVFTVAGQPPVTEKVVIKESERARHKLVTFGRAAPKEVVAVPRSASSSSMGGRQVAGLVTGGAGVVAIGLGSVFGVLTAGAISQQKSDCASAQLCPRPAQAAADHATWTTDGNLATVAFVAGGALIAGGVVLYLTGHRVVEQTVASRLVVAPSMAPGGAGMLLRGEF